MDISFSFLNMVNQYTIFIFPFIIIILGILVSRIDLRL
jgi:hypothetical protein